MHFVIFVTFSQLFLLFNLLWICEPEIPSRFSISLVMKFLQIKINKNVYLYARNMFFYKRGAKTILGCWSSFLKYLGVERLTDWIISTRVTTVSMLSINFKSWFETAKLLWLTNWLLTPMHNLIFSLKRLYGFFGGPTWNT